MCVCVSVWVGSLNVINREKIPLQRDKNKFFFLKEGCDSFFSPPTPLNIAFPDYLWLSPSFSFRVGYSSVSVCVSVCLCLTSWGLFGLVDGVFCCSVWWFCLPVKRRRRPAGVRFHPGATGKFEEEEGWLFLTIFWRRSPHSFSGLRVFFLFFVKGCVMLS